MSKKTFIITALVAWSLFLVFACSVNEQNKVVDSVASRFDSKSLKVQETSNTKKLRGQVIYLPVYSNIPYSDHGRKFDLNAFIAVHNTDLTNTLKITRVLFFDNEGQLVSNYLTNEVILQPLGATNFYVPEKDKSGTGANFIVEWVADTLISEPLIESVMIGLTGGQGVSFTSVGRIIREAK